MSDQPRIETSAEVYAVIWARHNKELVVAGSRTHMFGDPMGDPDERVIYTEWRFDGADYPLMAMEYRATISDHQLGEVKNERHRYWLFAIEREWDE